MDPEALITDELVCESLKKDRGSEAKLVAWTQEAGTKSGHNFFNVVKRINVIFSEANCEKTISYTAKINPCKPNDVFNPYRQRAMLKEVFFYDTLVPLLNVELQGLGEKDLRVPKYLHSNTENGREVLVFEDLGLKGFETFDIKNPMDDAHIKLMAEELSRLHAASLSLQANHSEDLGTKFPLLIESWHCQELNLREAFAKVFQKGMLLNVSLAKALGEYQDLLPWLQDLSSRGMDTIKKEMDASPPWRGICHGDYHKTNVLFKYDDSRKPIDIRVIDWQTVRMSHMASEFGYLAYSSFRAASRKSSVSYAVDSYAEKFQQILGPKSFFNAEELLSEVDSNQFGILICFYLIPLSLCVSEPSELFKIDPEEIEKYNSKEADEKAENFLKDVPYLSNFVVDILEDLKRKNMHITH